MLLLLLKQRKLWFRCDGVEIIYAWQPWSLRADQSRDVSITSGGQLVTWALCTSSFAYSLVVERRKSEWILETQRNERTVANGFWRCAMASHSAIIPHVKNTLEPRANRLCKWYTLDLRHPHSHWDLYAHLNTLRREDALEDFDTKELDTIQSHLKGLS